MAGGRHWPRRHRQRIRAFPLIFFPPPRLRWPAACGQFPTRDLPRAFSGSRPTPVEVAIRTAEVLVRRGQPVFLPMVAPASARPVAPRRSLSCPQLPTATRNLWRPYELSLSFNPNDPTPWAFFPWLARSDGRRPPGRIAVNRLVAGGSRHWQQVRQRHLWAGRGRYSAGYQHAKHV